MSEDKLKYSTRFTFSDMEEGDDCDVIVVKSFTHVGNKYRECGRYRVIDFGKAFVELREYYKNPKNTESDTRKPIQMRMFKVSSYDLCFHPNAHHFHDNAPKYCPDCGRYLE